MNKTVMFGLVLASVLIVSIGFVSAGFWGSWFEGILDNGITGESVSSSGLVTEISFDDSSGYELKNGAQVVSSGYEKVLKLDGEDDYAKLNTNIDFTKPYSIFMWVKVDDWSKRNRNPSVHESQTLIQQRCIGCSSGSRGAMIVGIPSLDNWNTVGIEGDKYVGVGDKIAFMAGRNAINNDLWIFGNTKIENDLWYPVAVVYDGSHAKVYVGGRLEKTERIGSTYPGFNTDLVVGGVPPEVSSGWKNFNGYIDNIKIYQRALTDKEVSDLSTDIQLNAVWGEDNQCNGGYVRIVCTMSKDTAQIYPIEEIPGEVTGYNGYIKDDGEAVLYFDVGVSEDVSGTFNIGCAAVNHDNQAKMSRVALNGCGDASSGGIIKEICHNGLDDDNDGFIDCEDTECLNVPPTCVNTVEREICDNGVDDNGNGLVDCREVDCFYYSECSENGCTLVNNGQSTLVQCPNDCVETDKGGFDYGSFGTVSDPYISVNDICDPNTGELVETYCSGASNSQGKGVAKTKRVTCPNGCENGRCIPNEICNNEVDDDGDGAVDCDDSDCSEDVSCAEMTDLCVDGVDNDGDGGIDCDDNKQGLEFCSNLDICKELACTDGIDNDNDGRVDCEDKRGGRENCLGNSACVISYEKEICNDLGDNDGDGLVDCDDSDCSVLSNCNELSIYDDQLIVEYKPAGVLKFTSDLCLENYPQDCSDIGYSSGTRSGSQIFGDIQLYGKFGEVSDYSDDFKESSPNRDSDCHEREGIAVYDYAGNGAKHGMFSFCNSPKLIINGDFSEEGEGSYPSCDDGLKYKILRHMSLVDKQGDGREAHYTYCSNSQDIIFVKLKNGGSCPADYVLTGKILVGMDDGYFEEAIVTNGDKVKDGFIGMCSKLVPKAIKVYMPDYSIEETFVYNDELHMLYCNNGDSDPDGYIYSSYLNTGQASSWSTTYLSGRSIPILEGGNCGVIAITDEKSPWEVGGSKKLVSVKIEGSQESDFNNNMLNKELSRSTGFNAPNDLFSLGERTLCRTLHPIDDLNYADCLVDGHNAE